MDFKLHELSGGPEGGTRSMHVKTVLLTLDGLWLMLTFKQHLRNSRERLQFPTQHYKLKSMTASLFRTLCITPVSKEFNSYNFRCVNNLTEINNIINNGSLCYIKIRLYTISYSIPVAIQFISAMVICKLKAILSFAVLR